MNHNRGRIRQLGGNTYQLAGHPSRLIRTIAGLKSRQTKLLRLFLLQGPYSE